MAEATTARRGGKRPGAGRPKLPPDRKRTSREISLAPAVWMAVEATAARFGLSVSAAIEELVQAGLERATGRRPTDP